MTAKETAKADTFTTDINRRDFLGSAAAAGGAFVLGFHLPESAKAASITRASHGAPQSLPPARSRISSWRS